MEKTKWYNEMKNLLINNLYFNVYNKLKFEDNDLYEFVNIIDNSNDVILFCTIEFNFLINFLFKRDYKKYKIIKDKLLLKLAECPLLITDNNLKNELNTILKCKYFNGLLDINTCNNYILKYLNDESLLSKYIKNEEKNKLFREISIYLLETVIEDFTMNKEIEITERELVDDINISTNKKLIAHVDPFLVLSKNNLRGRYIPSKNIIQLNELQVINLEYENIKILDTIFHEIYHSIQLYEQFNDPNLIINIIDNKMREDPKINNILGDKIVLNDSVDVIFINYSSYMMKKETLLEKIIGTKYNEQNYKYKFIEIDARLNAHKELKKYLIDININDIYFYYEKIDIDELIKNEQLEFKNAIYKKGEEKLENLNIIFNKYLSKDLIEENEILNIEYNNDCTLKNAYQLLNDLELKLSKTHDINKINKILDLYYNLIITNFDRNLIIEYATNNKIIIDLKKQLIDS